MSIFNKGLFKETMRRLILPNALLTLLICFMGVGNILERSSLTRRYTIEYVDEYLLLFSCLIAIVLPLCAFNFIFKRKACDFHGALPYSPLERYVTITVAVFCQILFHLITVGIILSVVALICEYWQVMLLGEMLNIFLNVFGICFMLAGFTIFNVFFLQKSGRATFASLMFLLISFLKLFIFNSKYEAFSLLKYLHIYVIMGVVFLLLGFLTFKRQGFEPKFTIFRQMYLETLPIYLILDLLVSETDVLNLFYGLTFFIFSFFTFLINVISLKTLKKCYLCFASVTLSFVLFLTASVIPYQVYSYISTSETLTKPVAVTLASNIKDQYTPPSAKTNLYYDFYTYQAQNAEKIFISDPQVLDILDENGKYPANTSTNHISLTFKDRLGRISTKTITLSTSNRNKLVKIISQNQKYKEAFLTVPKYTMRTDVYVFSNSYKFTVEDRKTLYETFYKEFNTLTQEEKEYVTFYDYAFTSKTPAKMSNDYVTINAYVLYGKNAYSSLYRFNEEVMPNTFKLYKELIK